MSAAVRKGRWTRALTAALVRLRRQGLSYGEIATTLGVSRSAAVAKAVFAGLARASSRQRLLRDVRVMLDEPEPLGAAGEILGLGVCHWIRGDSASDAWRMCGYPSIDGRAWCMHHKRRVFASSARAPVAAPTEAQKDRSFQRRVLVRHSRWRDERR